MLQIRAETFSKVFIGVFTLVVFLKGDNAHYKNQNIFQMKSKNKSWYTPAKSHTIM